MGNYSLIKQSDADSWFGCKCGTKTIYKINGWQAKLLCVTFPLRSGWMKDLIGTEIRANIHNFLHANIPLVGMNKKPYGWRNLCPQTYLSENSPPPQVKRGPSITTRVPRPPEPIVRTYNPDVAGNKRGFVYLLRCGSFYKIGMSISSVKDRVSSMKTGNPYPIYLVQSWPVYRPRIIEKAAHKKLKKLRKHGEWFGCDEAMCVWAVESAMKEHITYGTEPLRQ